jgi:hypothetical protein
LKAQVHECKHTGTSFLHEAGPIYQQFQQEFPSIFGVGLASRRQELQSFRKSHDSVRTAKLTAARVNLYVLREMFDNPPNLRLVQLQPPGPIGRHGIVAQIASTRISLPMAKHRTRGVVV